MKLIKYSIKMCLSYFAVGPKLCRHPLDRACHTEDKELKLEKADGNNVIQFREIHKH